MNDISKVAAGQLITMRTPRENHEFMMLKGLIGIKEARLAEAYAIGCTYAAKLLGGLQGGTPLEELIAAMNEGVSDALNSLHMPLLPEAEATCSEEEKSQYNKLKAYRSIIFSVKITKGGSLDDVPDSK